jgi:sRNA-binding carbon storage regulator CsrA
MQQIIDFFNHPFFIIVGGLTTSFAAIAVIFTIFFVVKGVLPVWYRLGMGLTRRKITVFAEDEFDNLKGLLVDSKIFQGKNIIKIERNSIKKAASSTLLLVHWKCFETEIEDILRIKKDSAALIIYAPRDEGTIKDKEILEKINQERNAIIVNFRGRLLNDILTCMITTSYGNS